MTEEEQGNGEEEQENGHSGHGSQQIRYSKFQSRQRPGQRPSGDTHMGKRPDRKTRI